MYRYCKLALLLKKVKHFLFYFPTCIPLPITRGRIRIRIWLGIKMESWIRIGIKTMPIHSIVFESNTRVATGVQSQMKIIQGADDKLGQFLDQDIEASASHRNFLRHPLKSCSSLVSPNVNKPLISTKMSR
jgi:hypothetical protein